MIANPMQILTPRRWQIGVNERKNIKPWHATA